MRILQVTGYFSQTFGGSAEVPYQLSKKLAEREHQVTVYTSDYRISQDYLNSLQGVKVQPFRTWLSISNFNFTPTMINKAAKELEQFDVIHLHNFRTFQNIVIRHYAKKYGIPYVLHTHGSLAKVISKQNLKIIYDNFWGRRIIADASRLIASTLTETEQYGEFKADKGKIVTVPNCIEISDYEHLPGKGVFRKEYGITEEYIILFVGRIDRIKGLDILIKAVAELDRKRIDYKLVIMGPDSGYLPTVKDLIKEYKLEEKVIITGFVPSETKLAAYVDADVYVIPSVYETFPTTALEAGACGTPVIVTDRCQMAHLFDNTFGLVVPYDHNRLYDALIQMLNDEEMRVRFGETGKALVREKYTWSHIAEQIEEIYGEVVK
ncbi:glycosyltransferase [Chloroflexota bacterium]